VSNQLRDTTLGSESLAGGTYPVATVVISGSGASDQAAGNPEVKASGRHRFGVAAAAVLAALLITGAVMQALTLRRVTRERDWANRITNFMTRMFKVSDPSEARGNSITAREVLDKASKDLDTGLPGGGSRGGGTALRKPSRRRVRNSLILQLPIG
jgi:hypothetical protein